MTIATGAETIREDFWSLNKRLDYVRLPAWEGWHTARIERGCEVEAHPMRGKGPLVDLHGTHFNPRDKHFIPRY
ncbi:hypothetical protein [Aureimonas populi]|uniref:Uncharacterized protein n=1 Tax=Aureimonas populi TaxID=1701758 RepID=A0ABW5CLD6_9HYPH|nr:hypothetical protein [Aureimonas populi]